MADHAAATTWMVWNMLVDSDRRPHHHLRRVTHVRGPESHWSSPHGTGPRSSAPARVLSMVQGGCGQRLTGLLRAALHPGDGIPVAGGHVGLGVQTISSTVRLVRTPGERTSPARSSGPTRPAGVPGRGRGALPRCGRRSWKLHGERAGTRWGSW
ncbi:hypothetical protein QJS66_09390 [Kocuria rhizophila]|nr:hypothetical protein QJS66_09390 [Kocuria rhizophila]